MAIKAPFCFCLSGAGNLSERSKMGIILDFVEYRPNELGWKLNHLAAGWQVLDALFQSRQIDLVRAWRVWPRSLCKHGLSSRGDIGVRD
jgi:hypothetical protein